MEGSGHRSLTIDGVWAVASVLACVAAALTVHMQAIDLAYHVRAGQAILTTGHPPAVDAFTFTVRGHAWLDQQWGAQVIIALAYRAGGWPGLAILHTAIVGGTFWLLWLACRARGASVRTSSALTLFGFVVCFVNTGMRPQSLAYPLFAASLWILSSRRDHPRRLWLLPPMVALWANVHGSFALALVLLGLAWLEDRRDRAPTARTTLIVGATSLAATVASPYGIGVWRYAIGITTNARILGQITEWQATSIRSVDGALFYLSVCAVVVYLLRRGMTTDPLTLAWLGFFVLLALPAARGIVWWGFVFPVVLAGLIVNPAPADTSERRGDPIVNVLIVVALVALIAVELPWRRDRVDPASGSSALLAVAPQNLVTATRSSVPPAARLFVSQPFASWFEFALPADPVFVDSRIELFPDRVWNDYLDVMNGVQGWQGILDRWHVDAVVLQRKDATLGALIANDPGWRPAYRDPMGAVYVRT